MLPTKRNTKSQTKPALLRAMTLLLAICFVLPLALSALAQGQKPVTNLFGSELADSFTNMQSMAKAGDTLYLRTNDAVYAFAPGDTKAVKVAQTENIYGSYGISAETENTDEPRTPNINYLFGWENILYGLDSEAQTLYEITIAQGKLNTTNPLKLDLEQFFDGEPPYRYFSTPQWMNIMEGKLYMKFYNYEEKQNDLYSFDIKTGERKAYSVLHLQTAAEYEDGKLIAAQLNPTDAYDYQTGTMKKPQLVVFDPANDSMEELGVSLPAAEDNNTVSSLYYDQGQKALFTYTDTDLYRLEGDFSAPQLIGYLPMFGNFWPLTNGGLQPLPDGRLAVGFGQNVYIRPTTDAGLQGVTVLSIGGGIMDPNIFTRVLMEMDDVTLRRMEGINYGLNQEQLASMFLTGSVNVDILPINVYSFDLEKLIEKGYLANISDNADIKNYMDSMAKNLSGPVMREDAIYAMPMSLMLFPSSAYTKRFEALGLEVPKDMRQLLALAQRWVEEYNDEYPEYTLISNNVSLKEALRNIFMDRYMTNRFGNGEDLTFDTPLFREMMTQIETMNYGDLDPKIDWESPESARSMEDFWQKKALLETGMGYEPRYYKDIQSADGGENAFEVMVLPLEESQDAYQVVDISMLAVLSTSPNQETAKRFLAKVIEKLHPVDKLAMDLSKSESLPNPDYDRQMAEMEKNLASVQAAYDKAEGAAKSNLEEQLTYMTKYVEQSREGNKYLITAEQLDEIHQLIAKLYIFTGLQNAQRQAYYQNSDVLGQYYAGTISLDQMIRQMDDKMRLLRMEYQ